MNKKTVIYILGCVLVFVSAFMLLPWFVSLIYSEETGKYFLYTAIAGFVIGRIMTWKKPEKGGFFAKEGFVSVALSWIVLSVVGAIPLWLSGEIPNFVDALFEIVSGFTTTGASIAENVEAFSHTALFWRSFSHWIGGMGVLVFMMAILPLADGENMHILRAESPGPIVSKLVPRMRKTAGILYLIYLTMTMLEIIALLISGLPTFDAVCMSLGTAGTGGFTVYNDGIAHYGSSLITYLVSIGVLVFGVNFNLYYYLMLRRVKAFLGDEELRAYIIIVLVSTGLITLNTLHLYQGVSKSVEMAFFQVSNIITTTGFGYGDITNWPLFSQFILLFLMGIGGSAGSTAGGLKVIRGLILSKIAKNQILSILSPHRVLTLHVNKTVIDKDTQHKILKYFAIYMMIILSLIFIVSLDSNDFLVVTSAVFSCFNNIGPILGTTSSFAIFSPISKILLSFAMIAGRLEIYPILLLFMKRTWSKR